MRAGWLYACGKNTAARGGLLPLLIERIAKDDLADDVPVALELAFDEDEDGPVGGVGGEAIRLFAPPEDDYADFLCARRLEDLRNPRGGGFVVMALAGRIGDDHVAAEVLGNVGGFEVIR